MIKVFHVSREYIMLFMHNNTILTFNWFTYFVAVNYTESRKNHREIFEIFQKYFRAKNFMKFYITSCYIWYREEGPGKAAALPSPLLAVPNVL